MVVRVIDLSWFDFAIVNEILGEISIIFVILECCHKYTRQREKRDYERICKIPWTAYRIASDYVFRPKVLCILHSLIQGLDLLKELPIVSNVSALCAVCNVSNKIFAETWWTRHTWQTTLSKDSNNHNVNNSFLNKVLVSECSMESSLFIFFMI